MSSDAADAHLFQERTTRRMVRPPRGKSDQPVFRGDGRLDRLEDTVGSNFRWVLGVFGAGFMILLSAYAAGFVILSARIDTKADALSTKLDALTRDFDTRMTRLEARGTPPAR